MIVGSCGVVGKSFFPDATGPISATGLAGMTEKATSALSGSRAKLDVRQKHQLGAGWCEVVWARRRPRADADRSSAGSSGNGSYSSGPSADVVISQAVNPARTDPMALYSGSKPSFIADRISFRAAGAGQVRAGDQNPYILYSKLVGSTTATPDPGGGMMMTTDPVAAELAATRKSVNDLVRNDVNSLMSNSALSSDDKQRLKQHLDSIRDVEIQMTNTGLTGLMCSAAGIDTATLNTYKSGFSYKSNGMIETVSLLHMQLVALAFACNYNRAATLQWGEGTDGTKYPIPSAQSLGWTFHQISHRVESDSAVGNNMSAEQAHHEIAHLRMQTLAKGFDAFNAHGLANNAIVLWAPTFPTARATAVAVFPTSFRGNGAGTSKPGNSSTVPAQPTTSCTTRSSPRRPGDKSTEPVNFGSGTGTGTIAAMLA